MSQTPDMVSTLSMMAGRCQGSSQWGRLPAAPRALTLTGGSMKAGGLPVLAYLPAADWEKIHSQEEALGGKETFLNLTWDG